MLLELQRKTYKNEELSYKCLREKQKPCHVGLRNIMLKCAKTKKYRVTFEKNKCILFHGLGNYKNIILHELEKNSNMLHKSLREKM